MLAQFGMMYPEYKPSWLGFHNVDSNHDDNNANKLRELLSKLDNVQEAHSLTGEMDYSIKVVSPDLKALSRFISDVLLPHEAVQNVKTAIVLDTIKSTPALPIGS